MKTVMKDEETALVQLCIRVAPDLRDQLHDAAVLEGVTVQALVISYVSKGLESATAKYDKPEPITQAAQPEALNAAVLTSVFEQPSALTDETTRPVSNTFVTLPDDTLPATSAERSSTTGLDDIPPFILEMLHLPCHSGPECAAYPSCASYARAASTPS